MVASGLRGAVDRLCAPGSPTGRGHTRAEVQAPVEGSRARSGLVYWRGPPQLPPHAVGVGNTAPRQKVECRLRELWGNQKGLSPGPGTILSSTEGPFAFQNLGC